MHEPYPTDKSVGCIDCKSGRLTGLQSVLCMLSTYESTHALESGDSSYSMPAPKGRDMLAMGAAHRVQGSNHPKPRSGVIQCMFSQR